MIEPVVHYTKLFVADLIISNKESEKDFVKSKLRYYNVAYMNDPDEGKILLQILKDIDTVGYNKIAACFEAGKKREDNNVYLGSFVPLSHQDELVMWRTYGRENNIEASGCSIVIGSEFFDGENSPLQADFKRTAGDGTANAPGKEKEALHQVVYYNKKLAATGKGITGPNAYKINNGLEKLAKALQNFIGLNEGQPEDSNLCAVINRVVFRTLSEIRYLFKSADYSYENELRVIQYVDSENERVQIDRTGSLPHRLYIESGQPVKPALQKIILGPKTPNPDQWLYLEVQMKKDGHKNMELEKSDVQFQ
jgi:hypothetical protein